MKRQKMMEVMAIVHGQSEYRICSSIKSNLRLKHEIISRDKGKSSIQITSIMQILNDSRFQSLSKFRRIFDDVYVKKDKLVNFTLFVIMDVDDCTEQEKDRFISKEMFRGHWLFDYIIPIYNDPNLEATMKRVGIEVKEKRDYIVIFPTSHGDLDLNMAKMFYEKIKQCNCSNMYEYVKHCILLAESNKINS